jgi:polyhydroxybutyrate depolymerase
MHIRQLAAAVLAIALAIGAAPSVTLAADAPPAEDEQEQLNVGGLARTFLVHLPPRFNGKTRMPAVIVLHGAGGTGAGTRLETGWNAKADREGFIVAYPDGTRPNMALGARFLLNPQTWNDGSGRGNSGKRGVDDVGFIAAVVDHLESAYAADPERIYVTGFSNGASMTWTVGVRLADRVAAIAPVSGHLWLKHATLAAPVPALFIIGTADPLNPIDGGDVKLPWGTTQYHPPVAQSLDEWRRLLGCAGDAKTLRRSNGVKEVAWQKCARGGELEYVTIDGLGHAWPGGQNRLPEKWVGKPSDKLNATEFIWQFFKAHPKIRKSAASG